MAKHRGYASDEQDDEREEETLHSEEDEEEEGWQAPMKRAALHPAISSICAALGGFEEFIDDKSEIYTAYSLGDQVVGCLKDLKRFWRMDEKDDDRTVARIFHEVGVLKKDLIPILMSTLGTGAKEDRIALACVELIGAMTWPINVAEELRDAQLLGELKQTIDYSTLLNAQLSYKSEILRSGALRQMHIILGNSLAKNRRCVAFVELRRPEALISVGGGSRDRTPKDENVISLVLHTFRNLAAMKDRVLTSESADAIEESSLQVHSLSLLSLLQSLITAKTTQSELILQLSSENILELLLAMAAQADSSDYAPWNMVVLDILHLIFRSVKPEELLIPVQKIEGNRLKDLLDLEARQQSDLFGIKGSRHSRFGTTIAVQSVRRLSLSRFRLTTERWTKQDGKKYILHKQSTLAEGPEKTLDKVKRSKAKKVRQEDDLAPPAKLRPEAIKVLYETSKLFLESAFNPFFASTLRDIRMERLKVRESDTIRFLFLARFFLEFFLLVYREEEARGISHLSEEGHDFGLIAEMTEPQAIGFVTQRLKVALEEKPPLWTDLHAGIDCFTQILLTIEALQASGNPEHVDVAEILQNKLYYEAETLDLVLTVLVKYNAQSYKYLDSVINLSYTLLRMLEKYSKSKAYMYVRKKKAGRAAKKKSQHSICEENDGEAEDGDGLGMGEDEEEEEIERGTVSFGEHAFQFEKFEQRFADEAVLATCMTYLESYKTFKSPEQMKRIVALMHRQAVKAKSEGLFYKPTVLELFKRLLEDPNVTSAREGPNVDLRKLIDYILRKFFKAVQEHPLLLLECFFPKTKTQLGKMRMGEADPYASSDDDTLMYRVRLSVLLPAPEETDPNSFVQQAKKIGEVEVQPGFTHTQQIGIAITCLVDGENLPLVELVKTQLVLASAARTEIVLTTDGVTEPSILDDQTDEAIRAKAAQLKGPSAEALALFVPHNVDFGDDAEKKEAATTNPHFKLLMRLLGWESTESTSFPSVPSLPPRLNCFSSTITAPESGELVWSIPAPFPPSKLDSDLQIIDDFLLDPVDPQNGKLASDLLRKKRKKPVRRRRRVASDDELAEGLEEDEDDAPKKQRQKKRKEEEIAYKSAQFIDDSDDEDNADRDALFFAAEAALREKLAAGAISTALTAGSKKKKDAKAGTALTQPTARTAVDDSSDDDEPKKKGKEKRGKSARGRGQKKAQKKAQKKTQFDSKRVSDLDDDDDDAMVDMLQRAQAQEKQTRGAGGASLATSSPLSTSTATTTRKRAASVASSSASFSAALVPRQGEDSDDDEEEAVRAVSQAKKKRRVILDSDEDD
ncbi:SPOSA6832_03222, partial [Sporobolomyces salmonicolor]